MKQDHTQGPWIYDKDEGLIRIKTNQNDPPNGTGICSLQNEDMGGVYFLNPYNNARRIVSCVNALEGIKHPGAISGVLEAAKDVLKSASPYGSILETGVTLNFKGEELESLQKALDALGIEEGD